MPVPYESKIFKQLTRITERLLSLAMIDQLYYSQRNFNGLAIQELLVLIPRGKHHHIAEVRPIIQMVMYEFPNINHHVFYTDEVRQNLFLGSGAFISRCHVNHLIYINPHSSPIMSNIKDLHIHIDRATDRLKQELEKINSFKQGYEFYFKRRDMQLCAFMLHQTFELLYRMTQVVFLGRCKISHHLHYHHKQLIHYLPQLRTIFDLNHDYDMYLLELLNSSYLSVRYENNYDIRMEDLECLIYKCQQIEELLKESCYEMLRHYKTQQISKELSEDVQ